MPTLGATAVAVGAAVTVTVGVPTGVPTRGVPAGTAVAVGVPTGVPTTGVGVVTGVPIAGVAVVAAGAALAGGGDARLLSRQPATTGNTMTHTAAIAKSIRILMVPAFLSGPSLEVQPQRLAPYPFDTPPPLPSAHPTVGILGVRQRFLALPLHPLLRGERAGVSGGLWPAPSPGLRPVASALRERERPCFLRSQNILAHPGNPWRATACPPWRAPSWPAVAGRARPRRPYGQARRSGQQTPDRSFRRRP
jgi:hypothetical protein